MLAPLARRKSRRGQGAAVSLDGRFDAALVGSRTLFVNWGSDAHRSVRRQPCGAVHALRPGDPRSARARTRAGRRSAPARGPRGAEVLSRGRARRLLSRSGVRTSARSSRFAKARGMKPVIAGAAEAWVVARELAGAKRAGDPRPAREPAGRFRPPRRALRQREDPARGRRADRVLPVGRASTCARTASSQAMRSAHGLPWEAGARCDHLGPGRDLRRRRLARADRDRQGGRPRALERRPARSHDGRGAASGSRANPWRCARGRRNSGTAISSGSRPTARDDRLARALAGPARAPCSRCACCLRPRLPTSLDSPRSAGRCSRKSSAMPRPPRTARSGRNSAHA